MSLDRHHAPNVLICAGLDPSGGAGLIADVRIVSGLGARPVGVVTASTVQDTAGARSVHPIDPEVIGHQLVALLGDIEVRAVKLGLLGSQTVLREIARGLEMTGAPVVWDPVGMPSRGVAAFDRELFDDALAALAPHLTLITPNAYELAAFAGVDLSELPAAIEAGRALAARSKAAVLVKGGHFVGDEAIDILVEQTRITELRAARVPGGELVHGTGCALSSAIAAHLALGADLVESCRSAKRLVAERIAAPVSPGRGAPAIV